MGHPVENTHKAVGKVDQKVKEGDKLSCIGYSSIVCLVDMCINYKLMLTWEDWVPDSGLGTEGAMMNKTNPCPKGVFGLKEETNQ